MKSFEQEYITTLRLVIKICTDSTALIVLFLIELTKLVIIFDSPSTHSNYTYFELESRVFRRP